MTNTADTCDTFVTTVAFVGLPNVGKSTLLNALIGIKIAPTTRKAQTTRRVIRGIKTVGSHQQIYFDTPGIVSATAGLDRFMYNELFQALEDVDQIIGIVDAKDAPKRHFEFLQKVKNISKNNRQKFIIAINKIDELKDKQLLFKIVSSYADEVGADDIIPISALKKDGLEQLFNLLGKSASPSEFLFGTEQFTDANEKEIVAELIREKAMLELQDELPYRVAVTIENFDESRREEQKKPLIEIEAVLHVERPTQKAIVIGKNGATIRTIGTRARKDIEYLLNCQVMLKLFVRVEPKWTTSSKALRKLGY